jgi:DNA invertase Pin-like site-specific DNA recombinase
MRHDRYIAYYRVRAPRSGAPDATGVGPDLEAQQSAVQAYLKGVAGKLIEDHCEMESAKGKAGKPGTSTGRERPELAKALQACEAQEAQLILANMGRLVRNAGFLRTLEASGVEFVACDFPSLTRESVAVVAAVAEEEHQRASARIKAALAAAKARGVKLGGDRGNSIANEARKGAEASKQVRQENAARQAEDIKPIIDAIKAKGITSLQAIAGVLNARGIKTARGARWHATSVKRIIERAG